MGPIGLTGPEGPQGPIGTMGPIGLTGPEGPIGLTGTMGPIGLTGPEGPIGTMGPIGLTGPEGPQGPIGTMGPIGLTGPEGPQGPMGTMGPIGLTGPEGPQGPQGPPFAQTFIHVDRETDQTLFANDSVIWDANQVVLGSAGHNSGESELYIWESGYYHMYYNLYHQEPCQFTIFKNNVVLPGTTIGSPTGSSQNSASIIFQLTEDDLVSPTDLSPSGFAAKLQVTNYSSFAPAITLNGLTGSGSASPQITATVTIFKLANLPV
jgi:hypothetical protein